MSLKHNTVNTILYTELFNLFQPIKSVKDVTLQFFSLTNIWLTINVGNKSGLNFANKNEGK